MVSLDDAFSLLLSDKKIPNTLYAIINFRPKNNFISHEDIWCWERADRIRALNSSLDKKLIEKVQKYVSVTPMFDTLKFLLYAQEKDMMIDATDILESAWVDARQMNFQGLIKSLKSDPWDRILGEAFNSGEPEKVRNPQTAVHKRIPTVNLPLDFK